MSKIAGALDLPASAVLERAEAIHVVADEKWGDVRGSLIHAALSEGRPLAA